MKFSMTEQENGDLLIPVTTWVGLTVIWNKKEKNYKTTSFLNSCYM